MKDIQLSQHFRLSEFTRSATATKLGIDNTPPMEVVVALTALCCNVLEPLRRIVGPITIGSGYRCAKLNAAVGGVKNSQHMTGEAADIHLPSTATGKKWFELIKTSLPHDQLIWERNSPTSTTYWIHVSCRVDVSKNRHQVIELLTKNK